MKMTLNSIAVAASCLMALGSVTLRFVEQYRAASIIISVIGVALAWYCLRIGKSRNHVVSCPFVVSRFPTLFVILGFLAIGLPEFFSQTISQWRGARMAAFLVIDTLLGTAFFLTIWIYARKPNVL